MNAALSVKFEELEQEGTWGLGSGRGAQWPLPGAATGHLSVPSPTSCHSLDLTYPLFLV